MQSKKPARNGDGWCPEQWPIRELSQSKWMTEHQIWLSRSLMLEMKPHAERTYSHTNSSPDWLLLIRPLWHFPPTVFVHSKQSVEVMVSYKGQACNLHRYITNKLKSHFSRLAHQESTWWVSFSIKRAQPLSRWLQIKAQGQGCFHIL